MPDTEQDLNQAYADEVQAALQAQVFELEKEGLVTRTFRRLDPERQTSIVGAIIDEAADRGPAGLNIKQVAERAGAAVGSLYQYFGSRDGLLQFAIRFGVHSVIALFNVSRPYLVAMPLREGLRAYIAEGVKWGQGQLGLTRFFARAAYEGDPTLRESVVLPVATTMRSMVHDMLTQAAARGEIRPEVDLEAAGRVVNALTIAVADPQLLPHLNAYFQVTDKDMPPERLLNAAVDLILDGIGTAKGKQS